MKKPLRMRLTGVCVAMCSLLLASCAAMTVAIEKKDLDVQTRMSDSIILPPVAPAQMSIWANVRNTSDRDLNIESLRSCHTAKGYRLASGDQHTKQHFPEGGEAQKRWVSRGGYCFSR